MEERERDRGYRGYHFILERRDPTEAKFKFELQIKTLPEEAWDAKTHDVSYKPTAELQPHLLDHMRLLSKALTVIDEQSEVLKKQILQEEAERALHQRAAVLIWLSAVEDKDKPLLPALGFPDDPSKFKKNSSLKVLKRIRAKERSAGLDAFLCRCYAILTVLDGGDELKSEALAAADRFGRQREHFENHKVASYVHWGLGDFRQAIDYTKSAIEMLEGETKTASGKALEKLERELQEAKNQFIYWVCEGSDRTSVELARTYLDDIDKESPINTDTWGYFKIVFGDDPAEIEEGRRLIEQACAAATSREEQVAEVFYLKHEHLAQRRLSEMFSQRVERSLYPYLKGGRG